MDDRDKDFIKRVNDIQTNIRNFKTNQTIGGDSWVVYRTAINFTNSYNKLWQVDFIPDTAGSFVAKAYWTTQDRGIYGSDQEFTPDPNYFGRWYYFRSIANNGAQIAETIMVYSTKKGTIVMTQLNPTTSP